MQIKFVDAGAFTHIVFEGVDQDRDPRRWLRARPLNFMSGDDLDRDPKYLLGDDLDRDPLFVFTGRRSGSRP